MGNLKRPGVPENKSVCGGPHRDGKDNIYNLYNSIYIGLMIRNGSKEKMYKTQQAKK